MKHLLSLLVLTVFFAIAYSQVPTGQIMSFSDDGLTYVNLNKKTAPTEGSYFIHDSWNAGIITLYSGAKIKNYPFKYNMQRNQIEIKTLDDIKVLPVSDAKEFVWITKSGKREYFLNCYEFDGNAKTGFYKVISQGNASLLKYTNVLLMEANYNAAMDAGSQSKRYTRKEDYFVHMGTSFKKVRTRKNTILEIFEDKSESVENFAKQNRLKYKNEEDLAKIFDYYNSI